MGSSAIQALVQMRLTQSVIPQKNLNWLALKEPKLSYYVQESLLYAIHP